MYVTVNFNVLNNFALQTKTAAHCFVILTMDIAKLAWKMTPMVILAINLTLPTTVIIQQMDVSLKRVLVLSQTHLRMIIAPQYNNHAIKVYVQVQRVQLVI